MAAHLARIRISGFKSFADPVALDVLPGLTGLVGAPSTCWTEVAIGRDQDGVPVVTPHRRRR